MPLKQLGLFLFILLIAAVFEVGGDAFIRIGEKEGGWLRIIIGSAALVVYGVVINLLSGPEWISKRINKWANFDFDLYHRTGIKASFSKQLGVYVAVFALVSVVGDWLLSRWKVPTFETASIPPFTWIGLGIIWVGSMFIYFSD
jgi:small multidrug resistance family-3 protein